jgi:uncharacterized surface protein with fasciclin (FAS1) repeats
MKKINNILLIVFAMFIMTACGNAEEEGTTTSNDDATTTAAKGQSNVNDDASANNILQIAIGSKDHTTLVAAVIAAGLEDVLVNAGPLTVFAPTNEAFEKLPKGTVEMLLKPENKEKLATIIKYHAAPGSYGADNIKGVMGIGQATGDKVKVETVDGVTTVNGAKVLGTVKASNGIVHVIDAVLLPPEK